MGRYVITEWWSQRGIKMFQTNITPMHSAGIMHCAIACACLPVLLNKLGRVMEGNKKCASVCWVCLLCEWLVSLKSLWFQSVTVSRDCGSVSAAPLLLPSLFCLSSLSWVQLNTCSMQEAHSSAGVPKQLKATRWVHVPFVSPPSTFH